jgi:hypothetical protein
MLVKRWSITSWQSRSSPVIEVFIYDMTLVKRWSNTGQTLVEHWSNSDQTLVNHQLAEPVQLGHPLRQLEAGHAGEHLVKQRGQTLVKEWSKAG